MYKTKETAIRHIRSYEENFDKKNFDLFRNNKEVVLEAAKRQGGWAIACASKEIQELFPDRTVMDKESTIRVLQSAILAESLQAKLAQKQQNKPTMKI